MAFGVHIIAAEQDSLYQRELVAHLKALRQLQPRVTTHTGLDPGVQVRKEQQRLLQEAEVLVVLLSQHLSQEAWAHAEGAIRGGQRVIPVRLRTMLLEGTPFCDLALMPAEGECAASRPAEQRDEVWAQVARIIEQAARSKVASVVPAQAENLARSPKTVAAGEPSGEVRADRPIREPSAQTGAQHAQLLRTYQMLASGGLGVLFLLLMLTLALVMPQPSDFQIWVFRVILAVTAAAFGAVVPGFIDLEMKREGLFLLRAGGAVALFVVIFLLNPPAMVKN